MCMAYEKLKNNNYWCTIINNDTALIITKIMSLVASKISS